MAFVSVEAFVVFVAVVATAAVMVVVVAVMAAVTFVIVVAVVAATRPGLVGRGQTAKGRCAPLSAGHASRGGGRGGRAAWHPVFRGGLFSSGRRLGHRLWRDSGLRNTV